MNESEKLVTFLRPRKKGKVDSFVLEGNNEIIRVCVYSEHALGDSSVRDGSLSDVDRILASLENDVREDGKGGAIVAIHEKARGRFMRVIAVAPKKATPFDRFCWLVPGYPRRIDKVSRDWVDLTPGSHLLVPVDKAAEDHLVGLIDHLEALPPDLESAMLHAIRRPSLDVRLERVEQRIFGRSEEENGRDENRRGFRSFVGRLMRRLGRPQSLWPAAVGALAFALLATIAGCLYVIFGKVDAIFDLTAPQPVGRPVDGSQLKFDQLSAEVRFLIDTTAGLRGKSANLRALYGQSFAPLERNGIVDQKKLSELLADSSVTRDPLTNGLIKLQVLVLAAGTVPEPFFAEASLTETKQLLIGVGESGLKSKPEQRDLLAFLACQLNNAKEPKLGSSPEFTISNEHCTTFTVEKARPGLEELVQTIRSYAVAHPDVTNRQGNRGTE